MPLEPAFTALAVVGRQPIFDSGLRVRGYELLFRADPNAQQAGVIAGDVCTALVVVNSFVEFGIDTIVGSATAFVNVNREFILSDVIHNLPKDRVVLEILEDVPPEREVIAKLEALAAAGYRLALDDFVYREALEPFLELASIAKLDISQLDRADLLSHLERLKRRGLSVVAERIETHTELETCTRDGFDMFQGFFLARPATLQRHRAPDGDKLAALQTLSLLNSQNTTIEQLERAIGGDVTLSYRLLRVVNSAACGLPGRIESLRQAILHVGRDSIRNWVSLLLLSGLSNKPAELTTTGLVRARMCERIGNATNPGQAPAYFTAGLFSILDAVLDTPMSKLVTSLSLTPQLTQALTDRQGPIGAALAACLAYERWEFDKVSSPGMSPGEMSTIYLDALSWSRSLTGAVASG